MKNSKIHSCAEIPSPHRPGLLEDSEQPLGTLVQPYSAQDSSRTRQIRVYQRLVHWARLRFGMVSQQARPWLIDLEAFSQNFTLFFSTLQPMSQHRVKYQGRFRGVVFFCSSLNSLSQVVVVVVPDSTLQDLYVIFAALRKCPVGAINHKTGRNFDENRARLFVNDVIVIRILPYS